MKATRTAAAVATMVLSAAIGAVATAQKATLTGTVGDDMCGVTHMVKGDDAKCTRLCVQGGASYALIVKGKAYTIKADSRTTAALDKLVGQNVTVTGTLDDKTIDVTTVKAVK